MSTTMEIATRSLKDDEGRRRRLNWKEAETVDYGTVARAGGRKDLLDHIEKTPEKRPFSEKEDYKSPLRNHWSHWNTSDSASNKDKHVQHKDDKEADVKLPPLVAGDKEETNISKLLSLDYQREWLEKRDTKLKNEKKKAKEKRKTQLKKLRDHGVKKRQAIIKNNKPKERFVMKRFKNISSVVKLPPI